MQNLEYLPEEEKKHFIKCGCGKYIDMRNLAEIMSHQHEMKTTIVEWDYSMKVGEPAAYNKKGKRINLN